MNSRSRIKVSPFQTVHVVAYCEAFECGFQREWNPPHSKLDEAKKHTRETGHMVAVDETRISNITLEALGEPG